MRCIGEKMQSVSCSNMRGNQQKNPRGNTSCPGSGGALMDAREEQTSLASDPLPPSVKDDHRNEQCAKCDRCGQSRSEVLNCMDSRSSRARSVARDLITQMKIDMSRFRAEQIEKHKNDPPAVDVLKEPYPNRRNSCFTDSERDFDEGMRSAFQEATYR